MGGRIRYFLAITAGASMFVFASVALSHANWAQPYAPPQNWNFPRLAAAYFTGAALTFFGCDGSLRQGQKKLFRYLLFSAIYGFVLFGASNVRAPIPIVICASLVGFAVGALSGISFWLTRRPDREVRV